MVKDFSVVVLYNTRHVVHATIADLCVSPVKDLVECVHGGKMFCELNVRRFYQH